MSATFHTTLLQSFMGSVVFPVMNELFRHNRRMMKAYLLKESLDRLWTYTYEGAARRYLNRWIDQLKWQRLKPFEKLARMLLRHEEGLLNYCRMKVPFGVVEAVNLKTAVAPLTQSPPAASLTAFPR